MSLEQRVNALRERIAKACASAGVRQEDIITVAATKCVDISVINELPRFGITEVGENRVNEFNKKYDSCTRLNWHIIGALQTNKVKYAVGKVKLVQSVDRYELAAEIQKRSAALGIVTDVLLEVNIADEPSKSGVSADGLYALAEKVAECKNLRLRGLMSVPPIGAPIKTYCEVRRLYDGLKRDYPHCDLLSMGMSNDLELAIQSGANMIRPGRALFGERKITTKESGNEI